MKPVPPATTSPAELEAEEALEHDDFEEPNEQDSGALSDSETRRVERIASGIGKLTVDGVSALADKLAAARSPTAGLLSHCLQLAISASFRRGQGQRAP